MSQGSIRGELAFIQVGLETEILKQQQQQQQQNKTNKKQKTKKKKKKKKKKNVLTKNDLNVYSKTLVGCLCWSFTALRHILGNFERG